ncbi:MAG: sigma-54 dependent transcriptional regulator [Candidatus Margulisbacteria bacterium]|nr:sigma-54 dependent transcriptional regulator [Candidatus Margulisiibacteriota bacterium]
MDKFTLLAVDDEKDILKLFEKILAKKYCLLTASSAKQALKIMEREKIDAVLLDLRMPGMDGIQLLKQIKASNPTIEVIMVSASKDLVSAVETMKLGAFDYIAKPFEVIELLSVIEKALEKRKLVKENQYLKEALAEASSFGDLIGRTAIMKSIFEIIATVAKTDSRVLITGESGTGKELVARTIHAQSRRAKQPFVAVNCAAIPDNLLESELFGFERGAFTGAMERKTGKFEIADNGTIFLDEIGCMSPTMQAKLLRVIQEGQIDRVGGGFPISIDVRILAATNLDVKQAIADKQFREDLYYRMNVIPIHMPPLRERKDDIPLFIKYFLEKFNKEMNRRIQSFDRSALLSFQKYHWPGNVRELQNIVERLVALSSGPTISEEEVERTLNFFYSETPSVDNEHLDGAMTNFEKFYIKKALGETEGNKTKAAKMLGIARTTLLSKISSLRLN